MPTCFGSATRYVIERLLYRISRSPYRDEFVLKGAMLFRVWTDQVHRPTRDLDLLGKGKPTPEAMATTFRAICGLVVEVDGVTFEPTTVTAERIKEAQDYEGVRVGCRAHLGQARIELHIDVGFGDAVVPGPSNVTYPVMLEFPAPALRAYRLSPGTVYPVLHGLERAGYLTGSTAVVSGKRRKYYEATLKGRKALEAAREKLRELAAEVLEQPGPGPPTPRPKKPRP